MRALESAYSASINFAVMAVEASARHLGITPMEMYRRLSDVGLVKNLLLDCYDVMHTLSIKQVAEDVAEALANWEKKKGK